MRNKSPLSFSPLFIYHWFSSTVAQGAVAKNESEHYFLERIKMKHLHLLTLCLAALIFVAPCAVSVAADAPDAYAYFNISRGLDCQFAKSIAAQPEWKTLVTKGTQKLDSEYAQFVQSPVYTYSLPQELKDLMGMVLDKISLATGKKEFSSREILDVLRYEFEAVQVSLWFDPQVEKPEVTISIFTQFDPVELEDFLKFAPQTSYNRLKKDSSGTLYKFLGDKTVYVGFTQVANRGSYVIAVSEQQSRVEQQLAFAKSGEFLKTALASSGPFDKIEITPALLGKVRDKILQEIKSKSASDPNAQNVAQILENLEGFSLSTEDISGSTVTTLAVTMKKEEDAKDLKETAEGLVAFVKMFANFSPDIDENGRKAIGLLSLLKFEQDAKTIRVSFNYNTPEIESIIKELLTKALEELAK